MADIKDKKDEQVKNTEEVAKEELAPVNYSISTPYIIKVEKNGFPFTFTLEQGCSYKSAYDAGIDFVRTIVALSQEEEKRREAAAKEKPQEAQS